MRIVCFIGAAVIGYLLGSINSAVILSRLFYGGDVRKHGSGNAGTTNMLRTYGKKAALFTFLGDFAKGMLAVFVGWLLFRLCDPSWTLVGEAVAGAFAVLGHNWPLYFGLKGGKGVLTTFSVFLVVTPIPALIAFGLFLVIVALTRYVSLGSILAAASMPFLLFFAGDTLAAGAGGSGFTPAFGLTVFVALLIIARHHANIGRLLHGKESKLGSKKKESEEESIRTQ